MARKKFIYRENMTEDDVRKELYRDIWYNIRSEIRLRHRYLLLGTSGRIGGPHRDDRPDYMKAMDREATEPVGTFNASLLSSWL